MQPLVSILIPAYNSEKWVKSTIESALAQTWQNKEIIIVDDGSSDNTFTIAKGFESKNVKVVSQKNRGASAARNYALSFAQGDFIQWLDADDILDKDKIKLQLKVSDYNPNSMIMYTSSFASFYYRIKKAKLMPNDLWKDLEPKDWLIKYLHNQKSFILIHSWLVTRKLCELAGPWNEQLSYNDDGEYFFRMVSQSQYIKFVENARCYYRDVNSSSLSSIKSEKAIDSQILASYLIANISLKYSQDLEIKNAVVIYLQNFISTFPLHYYHKLENIIKLLVSIGGVPKPIQETTKYKLIRKFLGPVFATNLKRFLWDLEIAIKKYWDKLIFCLYFSLKVSEFHESE